MNISIIEENDDTPTLYWIPKRHKNPYRETYVACSSICSTKELSIVMFNTYCVVFLFLFCLFCFFFVLCILCCQFFGIVLFLIAPSVFSNVYLSCVLCILCCQFFLDCPFLIAPSVFSNVYSITLTNI